MRVCAALLLRARAEGLSLTTLSLSLSPSLSLSFSPSLSLFLSLSLSLPLSQITRDRASSPRDQAAREHEAVEVLTAEVVASPTLHGYLSAFAVASRLPPPKGSGRGGGHSSGSWRGSILSQARSVGDSGGGRAARLRFSLEAMLEVLEASLQAPQHRSTAAPQHRSTAAPQHRL